MSNYKVIVTARSFGPTDGEAMQILQNAGCDVKKLIAGEKSIPEQLKEEIVNADAVIAGLEDYDKTLIDSAQKLKIISRYGVGYDKVDLEAAKAKGIPVTITPGANGDSVADLAVTLMLSVARNIPFMDRTLKVGASKRPSGLEMCGKTLGVIGAGRIGKGVAERCKGFGMKLLLFDQYQDTQWASSVGAEYVDFDTIVKEADFITIHSPLTDETRGMFGKEQFAAMKNTAIIVNTARGGIIDEEALYDALTSGEIYGAGLDVTVTEPASESPLAGLDNCILTPHAGAATTEAGIKMSVMAAQNVVTVLSGQKCQYQVN